MKNLRFPQDLLQPFHAGNVWELKDSYLLIGDVGNWLVDYRHYRRKDPTGPKGPNILISKRELGQYLTANKAILAKQ
jgi:hypothetical protein